jgi:hypothetical protein
LFFLTRLCKLLMRFFVWVIYLNIYLWRSCLLWFCLHFLLSDSHVSLTLSIQYHDQEKGRSSARYGSSSRRPIISSSTRPSSSGDHTDSRTGRLTSSSSRPSTAQRIQPVYETKQPTYTRSGSTRGNRDDPLRSFELLSIRK